MKKRMFFILLIVLILVPLSLAGCSLLSEKIEVIKDQTLNQIIIEETEQASESIIVQSSEKDFPYTFSDHPVEAIQFADISAINAVTVYQIIEDAEQNIFLVWGATEGIWARKLDANGQLSESYSFPVTKSRWSNTFQLINSPDGLACVMWLNGMSLEQIFQLSCFSDNTWSQPQQISPLPKSGLFSFQAEYDPLGNLHTIGYQIGEGLFLDSQLIISEEDSSLINDYLYSIDNEGNFHLVYISGMDVNYKFSNDAGITWQPLETNLDSNLNCMFAKIPSSKNYFHYIVNNITIFMAWISDKSAMPGDPIFNGDEMFLKSAEDHRYLELSIFRLYSGAIDNKGNLNFLVDMNGLTLLRSGEKGAWDIQKLQPDGFDPVIFINKKGTIFFLWRSLTELFYANY